MNWCTCVCVCESAREKVFVQSQFSVRALTLKATYWVFEPSTMQFVGEVNFNKLYDHFFALKYFNVFLTKVCANKSKYMKKKSRYSDILQFQSHKNVK